MIWRKRITNSIENWFILKEFPPFFFRRKMGEMELTQFVWWLQLTDSDQRMKPVKSRSFQRRTLTRLLESCSNFPDRDKNNSKKREHFSDQLCSFVFLRSRYSVKPIFNVNSKRWCEEWGWKKIPFSKATCFIMHLLYSKWNCFLHTTNTCFIIFHSNYFKLGEFQTRSSFSLLSLLIDSLENADFIERDDFDEWLEWDEFDLSSSPFPTGFVVWRKSITNFNSRIRASYGVICKGIFKI